MIQPVFHGEVGQMYAIQYSDGEWYRVKVTAALSKTRVSLCVCVCVRVCVCVTKFFCCIYTYPPKLSSFLVSL